LFAGFVYDADLSDADLFVDAVLGTGRWGYSASSS